MGTASPANNRALSSARRCPQPGTSILCTGSSDNAVRLWDALLGDCKRVLQGHGDLVGCLAFHPAGRSALLASGSHDATVRIWHAASGQERRVLRGHKSAPPRALTFADALHAHQTHPPLLAPRAKGPRARQRPQARARAGG